MRPIKFRGKRLDNGEWAYGFYLELALCDGEGQCSYIKEDGYQPVKIYPATVGQFTGLFDKNGNEICEGDIVQTTNRLGVVEFSYGMFCVNDHNEETSNYYEDPANNWEIIGSIHSNPELLKNE